MTNEQKLTLFATMVKTYPTSTPNDMDYIRKEAGKVLDKCNEEST